MFPNKSDSWKNLRTPWIIQQWSAGNNTKGWLLLCSLYGLGNWGNDEIGNLPLVKELEIDRGTCMLDFKSLGFFSTYLSRLPITFFFFFHFMPRMQPGAGHIVGTQLKIYCVAD